MRDLTHRRAEKSAQGAGPAGPRSALA